MKIKDRKKNTKTYHYYNANPKGLYTGDCTYRAIALACNVTWETAVVAVALWMVRTGKSDWDANGTDEMMQEFGHWIRHKEPKHADGTKYTVAELAKELKDEPNPILIHVNGHMTVIKEAKVWDIWDCSREYVRTYWTKGE